MLPRSTALLQYLKNFSRTEQRVDVLIECPIPSWKALDRHKGLLLVSALIDAAHKIDASRSNLYH